MKFNCPFPFNDYPHIVLAHGGGGSLMKRLLDELILPLLEGETITAETTQGESTQTPAIQKDAALVAMTEPSQELAITTDSFVVTPLVFPGGDIGSLSVFGTINDLAMIGATPKYLSVGLILEEGLPLETLATILQSMGRAAAQVGVRIVTGDTKVVEHGNGDGIYINTTGVGYVTRDLVIGPERIQCGDKILVNGDLGRHGIAVMAQREGLSFDTTITSDCAPLLEPVQQLLAAGIDIHCMRDITRGGLSSTLNELALDAQLSFELNEQAIPVQPQLLAACEILGLDPLYVACEGRFSAIVPERQAERALAILQRCSDDHSAAIIGEVVPLHTTPVVLRNAYGSRRVLDMLSGEQLPRIC